MTLEQGVTETFDDSVRGSTVCSLTGGLYVYAADRCEILLDSTRSGLGLLTPRSVPSDCLVEYCVNEMALRWNDAMAVRDLEL